MSTFAIQYLETDPHVSVEEVKAKLRAAFERLPISVVVIGWNLSDALVNICARECEERNAYLYRWQPLLTSDGVLLPKLEWRTIGLNGEPVRGFQGLDEFTFICPNRAEVLEAVLVRVREVLENGVYHGMFLDRIRFPSPMEYPEQKLACFCNDCKNAAKAEDLDLESVRSSILKLLANADSIQQFVHILLDPEAEVSMDSDCRAITSFQKFRTRSINRFVKEVSDLVHEIGLKVGLDCFSPALIHSVGQDLKELGGYSEWIKIMSYGHTLGVAGLPFELSGIADWLIQQKGFTESDAFQLLSKATHLPLPPIRELLRKKGMPSEALAIETKRANRADIKQCLPAIELVDEEDLTNLNPDQIKADLKAFRDAGAEGLVLSWDLWFMPLERLDLVREVWSNK